MAPATDQGTPAPRSVRVGFIGRLLERVHGTSLLGVVFVVMGCRRATHVPVRTDAAPVTVVRTMPGGTGAREAKVGSRSEREPNDTPAQATEVGVPPETPLFVEGTLAAIGSPAPAEDVDYFRFLVPGSPPRDAGRGDSAVDHTTVAAPGRSSSATGLPVDAAPDVAEFRPAPASPMPPPRGAASALALEIVAGAPSLATVRFPNGQGQRSTAAAGIPHGFPLLAVAPGSVLQLELRRWEGRMSSDAGLAAEPTLAPNAYRVTARLVPLEGGDEREPNDQKATATPLLVVGGSAEASGFLAPAGDVDVFTLPGQAWPSGDLEASLDFPGQGSPGARAELEIFGPAGRLLAASRSRRKDGATKSLTFRPDGPGDAGALVGLWILVRSTGRADLSHRYVLRVKPAAAAP